MSRPAAETIFSISFGFVRCCAVSGGLQGRSSMSTSLICGHDDAQFEALHSYKSIAEHMMIEQGHRPEHPSNQAMKRPRFQESHGDTVHQGNALNRLHITRSFVKICGTA